MPILAKCEKDANSSDLAKCSVCSLSYHFACTKGGERKYQRVKDKSKWQCDVCSKDSLSGNYKGSDSDVNEDKHTILKAINSMESKMDKKFSEMQSSFSSLATELQQINSRVNDIQADNQQLKDKYEIMEKHNEEMAMEIHGLKQQVHDLQQYSRCNNLEIVGVPVTPNENVYSILRNIAQVLGVSFKEDGICIAHRLQGTPKKPHPSIIIKFVSRRTKEAWLSAAKAFKMKISATEIHSSFRDVPVFINEHLTSFTKMLLSRARIQVREGKLAYAWVVNAKVLVRKVQGGPAIRINSVEDLDKLIK